MLLNVHCKSSLIINTVISRGQINHTKNRKTFGKKIVQVNCHTA